MDLTLYDAFDLGVSRLHAAIDCGDEVILLTDLGSSNGTSLKAQPLMTNKSYILRDQDEMHLGKLVVHILFSTG